MPVEREEDQLNIRVRAILKNADADPIAIGFTVSADEDQNKSSIDITQMLMTAMPQDAGINPRKFAFS